MMYCWAIYLGAYPRDENEWRVSAVDNFVMDDDDFGEAREYLIKDHCRFAWIYIAQHIAMENNTYTSLAITNFDRRPDRGRLFAYKRPTGNVIYNRSNVKKVHSRLYLYIILLFHVSTDEHARKVFTDIGACCYFIVIEWFWDRLRF